MQLFLDCTIEDARSFEGWGYQEVSRWASLFLTPESSKKFDTIELQGFSLAQVTKDILSRVGLPDGAQMTFEREVKSIFILSILKFLPGTFVFIFSFPFLVPRTGTHIQAEPRKRKI